MPDNSSMRSKYLFPVASHTYFRITNKALEKELFLGNSEYVPVFKYGLELNYEVIAGRIEGVSEFDNEVRQSLSLAQAGAALQRKQGADETRHFRQLNVDMFGDPRAEYAEAIICHIHSLVTPSSQHLWDEAVAMLGNPFEKKMIVGPSSKTFNYYKQLFSTYTHGYFSTIPRMSLPDLLTSSLEYTGLYEQGWRVRLLEDSSHARVNQKAKVLLVGSEYRVRRRLATKRIAVHEVYGHALRGPRPTLAESEGFAILLEQLLNTRFKVRRAYRYLAASLGWGTFGKPMTFREVFEILWRVMAIASAYTQEEARDYAFEECARIFRGGRPEIAGCVYLKDTLYFSANIRMWEYLERNLLQYDEFVAIVEGRKNIL